MMDIKIIKKFFKPTKNKILITLILSIIFYAITLVLPSSTSIWSGGFSLLIFMATMLPGMLISAIIFPIVPDTWDFGVFILTILINYYFLSCVILLIYKIIMKNKTKEEKRKNILKFFLTLLLLLVIVTVGTWMLL